MSRIDRIREELGWLKIAFGMLVAIDVSVVAWLARNHASAEGWLFVAGAVVCAVVSVLMVLVNVMAIRRFRRLEDL